MTDIIRLIISTIVGFPLGVLLLSALAKLYQQLLLFQSYSEIGKRKVSDWWTILLECSLLLAVFALRLSAVTCSLVAIYTIGLFFYAYSMRGKQCNCFGLSSNHIGLFHLISISLMIASSIVGTVYLLYSGPSLSIYLVAVGIFFGLFYGCYWKLAPHGKHREDSDRSILKPIDDIERVDIFTQANCPACKALHSIFSEYADEIENVKWIDSESSEARALKVASFPAAQLHVHGGQSVIIDGIVEIVRAVGPLLQRSGR